MVGNVTFWKVSTITGIVVIFLLLGVVILQSQTIRNSEKFDKVYFNIEASDYYGDEILFAEFTCDLETRICGNYLNYKEGKGTLWLGLHNITTLEVNAYLTEERHK